MNVLAGSLVSLFSSVALIVYSLLCTESPAQELAVDLLHLHCMVALHVGYIYVFGLFHAIDRRDNTDIDTGDNLYKYLMLIRTPLTAHTV